MIGNIKCFCDNEYIKYGGLNSYTNSIKYSFLDALNNEQKDVKLCFDYFRNDL
jgi:hypothetical protein